MKKVIVKGGLNEVMPHFQVMSAKYMNKEITGQLRMSRIGETNTWQLTWEGPDDQGPGEAIMPGPLPHGHENPDACAKDQCDLYVRSGLKCFEAYHGITGSEGHEACEYHGCRCPCHAKERAMNKAVLINDGHQTNYCTVNSGDPYENKVDGVKDCVTELQKCLTEFTRAAETFLEAVRQSNDLNREIAKYLEDIKAIKLLSEAQPSTVHYMDVSRTYDADEYLKKIKKTLKEGILDHSYNPLSMEDDINIPIKTPPAPKTMEDELDEIDRRCEEDVRAIRVAYRERRRKYLKKSKKKNRTQRNNSVLKRLALIYGAIIPVMAFGIFHLATWLY